MVWGEHWRMNSAGMAGRNLWLLLVVSFVSLTITLSLYLGLKAQEGRAITEAVSIELAWKKESIMELADSYVKTSQHMAQHTMFYGNQGREEWKNEVELLMDALPGLLAIGWLDVANRVRYMSSRENEGVIRELILSFREAQPGVFEEARRLRAPRYSRIINLKLGGDRDLLIQPLFVKDQFFGFIVDVLDVGVAFGSIINSGVQEGWVYRLSDGHTQLRTSDVTLAPAFEKWAQAVTFQVPGVTVTLEAIPGPAVIKKLCGPFPMIALITGLVLSGLLTWGTWSAQTVKIKSDKLSEATRLLRQLREAMDDSSIISMTDLRGTITFANDNFCKISGYPREELIGKNHRIIKSGFHPKEYYTEMWRTVAHGKVWKGDFCNRAKDGSTYWVYSTIFPLLGEDGKPESYMGIRHDITERKLLEVKLATKASELQRSNQALEQFDHVVAHELKTPLTVIKMAAENLTNAGGAPLSPVQEDMVVLIDKNVDHMAGTINSLLRMAQVGSEGTSGVELKDVDLKRHLGRVIQTLQVIARKRDIRIQDNVPEGLPPIMASPGVFAEVLTNLMGNAIRYAAHEVVVELRLLPGKVQFGVRNDGPSIPAAQLSGLFEKFASDNMEQSPLFKGSGLGLYICKDLVTQMGGEIWAESEDGKGACFYFTLPISKSDPPVIPA